MFILLGMLAIAASDLLILPERRNFGGLHEVHEHDDGNGRLHYTPHTTTDITPFLRISFRTLFRLDNKDVLYGHILLNL